MPQLNDSSKGIALIAISILLVPSVSNLMSSHDQAEREYEQECDLQYRAISGNISTPDAGRCSELDASRAQLASKFFGVLALSIIVSLSGIVMLFPSTEGGDNRPPPIR